MHRSYSLPLILAATLFSAELHAADLAYEPQPSSMEVDDYVPAKSFDWTRIYAGVHGGYSDGSFTGTTGDDNGFVGGAQIGADMQLGTMVLGVELEGTYLGGKSSRLKSDHDTKVSQTSILAAKGRVGAAMDRTLIYGTAGLAVSKIDVDGANSDHGKWKAGYLVGAGIEYAFTDQMSLRAEYNYLGLAKDYEIGRSGDVDLRNHVVKAGINYRF
ncbi:MAG TPA: outer membrane protein [Rhizobium sp.]|nr:outer membrane protein [Rhizobium sp.]